MTDAADQVRDLEAWLAPFLAAMGRKTRRTWAPLYLRGLTPYEAICKAWTEEPQRFTLNPLHQMPGLNTYAVSRTRRMQ